MRLNLPVMRSPGARLLFLTNGVVIVAILLWTNHLSHSGDTHGLTTIFLTLFAIGDYAGANCALLVLLAAVFVAGRYSFKPLLQWLGDNPGLVAVAAGVVLAGGVWVVYGNTPLCMDEYSPYFQSRVFAAGHLAGQVPQDLLDWVVPHGFQDYFLNVSHGSGRIISAYWPSFALLLTPFVWLGIPWACNPLISALTLIAVHRVALAVFSSREAAGLALLLTIASPVFFANGISYYSMPAHLLANTVFALLLIEPTARKALTAGVLGSVALTLHNPVPHMLFAAPWIISILRRPGGLRLSGWLFAGYLPLCLILGVGWFLYSSNLTHEGMSVAAGASSASDTLLQMGSAFTLPSSTILLARLIGIAKLWVWAVPGLILLAIVGGWKWRHNRACLLLAGSAILTFLGYFFVPFDQGHGWGFRYFHSAWAALPILAAGALIRPPGVAPGDAVERGVAIFEDAGTRSFLVACALFCLVAGSGFRALQMHTFITKDQRQVPAYLGKERQVVIIDPSHSFYGTDLVRNDPWLRGPVIRMITHGASADAHMMHAHFPDMRLVYTDRYGTVWSAQHDADDKSPLASRAAL